MRRLFTLAEARAQLPRLRELAVALRERKVAYDRHREALRIVAASTRDGPEVVRTAAARHQETAARLGVELEALIEELDRLGIEAKGVEHGLFDFPCLRDGRVVYLCWKLDEPDIAWWHDLDTGFRGRRALGEE